MGQMSVEFWGWRTGRRKEMGWVEEDGDEKQMEEDAEQHRMRCCHHCPPSPWTLSWLQDAVGIRQGLG